MKRIKYRTGFGSKITLAQRSYRLNRSRRLELRPGWYDGRPVVTALRHCPEIVLSSRSK